MDRATWPGLPGTKATLPVFLAAVYSWSMNILTCCEPMPLLLARSETSLVLFLSVVTSLHRNMCVGCGTPVTKNI